MSCLLSSTRSLIVITSLASSNLRKGQVPHPCLKETAILASSIDQDKIKGSIELNTIKGLIDPNALIQLIVIQSNDQSNYGCCIILVN
jgi:hypothetical protein